MILYNGLPSFVIFFSNYNTTITLEVNQTLYLILLVLLEVELTVPVSLLLPNKDQKKKNDFKSDCQSVIFFSRSRPVFKDPYR
jgi:hypothetical protein